MPKNLYGKTREILIQEPQNLHKEIALKIINLGENTTLKLEKDANNTKVELSIHDKISRGIHVQVNGSSPRTVSTSNCSNTTEHNRANQNNSDDANTSPPCNKSKQDQSSVHQEQGEPNHPVQGCSNKKNGDPFAFTHDDRSNSKTVKQRTVPTSIDGVVKQRTVPTGIDGVVKYQIEDCTNLPKNTVTYRYVGVACMYMIVVYQHRFVILSSAYCLL